MNPATIDPNAPDYGTDVALLNDLAPVWGLASGSLNMAMSMARHLTQREGSMDFYDPSYVCFDIRGYCSAKLDKARIARLQGRISAAIESDRDRVQGCTAHPTFDQVTNTLTIPISTDTNDGPFDLVLSANAVTVALLAVNGVTLPAPLPVAAAAATGGITIIGGASLPGPPGPPGTSTPGRTWGLPPMEDNSGTEQAQIQTQFEIDFSALGASLTFEVTGMGSDSGAPGAGDGLFKLLINGSDGAADGTLVVTLTAASASATRLNASATIANPGGHGRAIMSVTSSANGKTAVLRGATFTIQS